MDKFVPIEKRSKREQKLYHAKSRRTWGDLNPVTRSVPNGKAYNRKKLRDEERKSSRRSHDHEPTTAFLVSQKICPA